MVLTARLIDGVDDEGDEPRVGGAWVPLGLVLKSTPTKHPFQLPQGNLHVTMVGLEGLSTPLVYELCLDSSPGRPFLGRGCRPSVGSLSAARGVWSKSLRRYEASLLLLAAFLLFCCVS